MSADDSTRSASQREAPLQFDIAEPHTAGADAGVPAPPAGLTCTGCKAAIATSYYEVNGAVVCARCRGALDASMAGASRGSRVLKAGLLGFGAAIVGAALYFAIAALTGYEIGLVAIAVGFLVGKAVQKGSGGRGGWAYQTMAVTFTYFAIVSTYIPLAVKDFKNNSTSRDSVMALAKSAEQTNDSLARANGDSAASEAADSTIVSAAAAAATISPARGQSAASKRRGSTQLSAGGVVLGIVVLLLFAAVAPILAGVSNIIGLLIIGIAVFEAWKLNKRVHLDITGPFRVGSRPVSDDGIGSTVGG
jgi:hypothetical protein